MSSLDAERHRLRLEQIEADRQRAEDAVKHARTPAASPVAEGFDRTGMPPIDQLARYEENAKLRFSPRRLRWKDVQELDERATALETRINEVAGELNERGADQARERGYRGRRRARRMVRERLQGPAARADQVGVRAARPRAGDRARRARAQSRQGAPRQGRVHREASRPSRKARPPARRAGAGQHAAADRRAARRPRRPRRRAGIRAVARLLRHRPRQHDAELPAAGRRSSGPAYARRDSRPG